MMDVLEKIKLNLGADIAAIFRTEETPASRAVRNSPNCKISFGLGPSHVSFEENENLSGFLFKMLMFRKTQPLRMY
jgi:hypothetical protein